MARRVSSLCKATQWSFLKNFVSGPVTVVYSQQLYHTQRKLLTASTSRLPFFTCYRYQHQQSRDSDESDDNDVPRVQRMKEHESILRDVIARGEPLSKDEWNKVKQEVFNLNSFVNAENIDAIIMGLCIGEKQFAVGSSLLDSLRESGISPNTATLARFLKLCYDCKAGDEESVLGICNEIRNRCPVLDASTADNVIHGLALTSRWQEGLELLSEIRLSAVPISASFNVLAEAAFKNGELKLGWELMEQMLQLERRPTPPVYKAWIDQCMRTKGSEASVMIGQLLDFWADHDLRPSLDVAEHLRSWFEHDKYSWEGCFTTISPRGSCQNCRTVLRKRKITTAEFEAMRKEFFEQVIVGSNVFLKSNPEELETFQQFLSRTAPYDVVIDGLNIAYSSGRLRPQQAVKALESVVQHFATRKKRMLVLGRRHMQNWPQKEMNYIHEHAFVFLAQNLSQDDPFLLYAAMYSGPFTQFVSRDLMRSHVYLLKDTSLRRIFRRWQQQRQLQLIRAISGHVTVMPPLSYNPSVQQGPGAVWHVPYDTEFKVQPKQMFEPPRHWLCLREASQCS
ncbi:uncharacterized protein GBIM_01707 [Gryllus bimaculatus]|nr:uncharacterized protein GBIM_01707 [Gryllus bimaculatus]